MIKVQVIFYFLLFFFAFGRFLPVFFAPKFLHAFFSSWGFALPFLGIIPLLGFLIYLIVKNITGEKSLTKELLFYFGLVIIYIALLFLTPLLTAASHKIVIAMNKNRAVKNFVNPILGHRLKVGDACEFGATYTGHPNDERGAVITPGVKRGTLINGKPCESIDYAAFISGEIGLTRTEVKLLYLPAEVAQKGLKHQSADEKRNIENDWYYVKWSATLRLF